MRTCTSYSLAMRYLTTSSCSWPTAPSRSSPLCPDARSVELDRSFLRELLHALRELLSPERIVRDEAREVLGSEARDALEGQVRPVGERVADLEDAGVVEADDVAGERLFDDGALLRDELRRVREAHLATGADVQHLHPALEAPGADAQERDAIAVRAVHVRLDLEDEAAEAGASRDRPGRSWRVARQGGGMSSQNESRNDCERRSC